MIPIDHDGITCPFHTFHAMYSLAILKQIAEQLSLLDSLADVKRLRRG